MTGLQSWASYQYLIIIIMWLQSHDQRILGLHPSGCPASAFEMLAILSFGKVEKGGCLVHPEDARPGYVTWLDCGPGPATWSWSCDCDHMTRNPGVCIPVGVKPTQKEVFRPNAPRYKDGVEIGYYWMVVNQQPTCCSIIKDNYYS